MSKFFLSFFVDYTHFVENKAQKEKGIKYKPEFEG